MKEKQKYVFLDFDGVVSSQLETPGSYITHEADEYGASPSCVARIKKLCDETGAKIIIASNWRRFPDDGPCSFWTHPKYARTVFNPLPAFRKQMEGYIAGVLPRERHITKAHALILWFEENNITQDNINYVIFDDDLSEGYAATYEYSIRDHFIQTSNKTGLVDADVEKAKEILAL